MATMRSKYPKVYMTVHISMHIIIEMIKMMELPNSLFSVAFPVFARESLAIFINWKRSCAESIYKIL